jgi:hypothetical protein
VLEGPLGAGLVAGGARSGPVLGRCVVAVLAPGLVVVGERPFRPHFGVATRALTGEVVILSGRFVAGFAVGLVAGMHEDEPGAGRVARGALSGLLRRAAAVVFGRVAGLAPGLGHIVAARARDGGMSLDVGRTLVDDSDGGVGGYRGASRDRAQRADLSQRRRVDTVSRIGVTVDALSVFGVHRMIEPGCFDLLVAAHAALVGNGRGVRTRKLRIARDVDPYFLHRLGLMRDTLDGSAVDVTLDTRDARVRSLGPRVVVGAHLVTGRAAERGAVGRLSYPESGSQTRDHAHNEQRSRQAFV